MKSKTQVINTTQSVMMIRRNLTRQLLFSFAGFGCKPVGISGGLFLFIAGIY
jgi:hypothetical protein